MNKRHDALLSAAELIQAVNRVIKQTPGNHVGTVGRILAEPGAPNVIPGKVVMSLEIRDLSEAVIISMYQQITQAAAEIAAHNGTTITFHSIDVDARPALTDKRIRTLIDRAAGQLGLSSRRMPSGAGHDAQDIAKVAPIGMIFRPQHRWHQPLTQGVHANPGHGKWGRCPATDPAGHRCWGAGAVAETTTRLHCQTGHLGVKPKSQPHLL